MAESRPANQETVISHCTLAHYLERYASGYNRGYSAGKRDVVEEAMHERQLTVHRTWDRPGMSKRAADASDE